MDEGQVAALISEAEYLSTVYEPDMVLCRDSAIDVREIARLVR